MSTLPACFEIDERITRMVERIVAAVDPEKVILFGSQARGEAGPDSDVDLLVVEREPFSRERSRRKELLRVNMAIREFDLSTDILLYCSDELEAKQLSSVVVAEACRDGKVLYVRY